MARLGLETCFNLATLSRQVLFLRDIFQRLPFVMSMVLGDYCLRRLPRFLHFDHQFASPGCANVISALPSLCVVSGRMDAGNARHRGF
jgi:hypothetical protein